MVAVEKKAQRYDAYKDSGVEWLGEIPEHWEIKKLKLSIKKIIDNRGRTPIFGDIGTPMLEIRNITNGLKNPTEDFQKYVLPEIVVKYERDKVHIDDVLISTVGATSGKVVIINKKPKYFIAQNVIGIRFTKMNNPLFMYFFLRSEYFISSLQLINKGNTIDNLKVSVFVNNICFFPPLPEQTKIAQFLDDKTTKIDDTIAIKQQQINLLKERKQILIHKAVTRGLDDSVTLKDSGVEWIGEIPEHWDLLPGFMVYKENKTKNDGMKEDVVLSLSYGNIVIKPKEKLVGLVPESFETYQIVKPGDIIIRCMDLQNDKTSLRTGIAVNDGIITSAYLNLNIINNNVSAYVYNFLHALDTTKVLYKFGTGLRQNLSFEDFKHLRIPIPPIHEQEGIVIYIENITQKIETAIGLKQQEIDKLKEYKSSLINGVVTGKVRVC
ncbi:restriction endonuclease subunit S [Winogradskyella sediminis]|uniref:restriction endonuclease subunit S n=1 Tax=Winogradskyella sediminis TaxID=1382466 RepID=UPI003AA87BD4